MLAVCLSTIPACPHRASSELSRLEGVEATWRLWETQAEELRRALRKDCDTLKVLDAAIQTGSLTDTATASMQDVERLLNDRRKSQPGKRLTLQHTRTQVGRPRALALARSLRGSSEAILVVIPKPPELSLLACLFVVAH